MRSASEYGDAMAGTRSSFEVLQAYLVARATFSAEDLAFVKTVFVPLSAGRRRIPPARRRGGTPRGFRRARLPA